MTDAHRLDPPPGFWVRALYACLQIFWRRRPPLAEPPQRILIVRPDRRVGNLLITTALVKSLRTHLPDAQVDMVVPSDRAQMLQGLEEIDHLHAFDQRDWLRPWKLLAWARRLRSLQYDLVLDASHWHTHSATAGILCRLVGGRWVVGSAGPGPKLADYSVPLDLPVDGRWPSELVMKTRLLRPIGIEEEHPEMLCPLGQRPEDRAAAKQWWGQQAGEARSVLLWLTTRKSSTFLDAERWVQALDVLPEWRDAVFGIGWGPGDEKLLADAIKVLEEKGVKAVALPPTSLDALAAYMLEADVVLSGDTGPLHLARSLRRPIVAFFRVGDGGRWCPTGHHIRRFSWGQDCFQEQWDQ
ncbi:MAG TPA: hypothetical protein DEB46_09565 [Myxococcales bacterium]|nr:hypothetical protein [Myxococcales bacterium]